MARGRLLPLYISTGCAVVGSVLVYGSPRRLAEIATTVRQDLEHYSATHTTGDVLVATIVLQVLFVERHANRALCPCGGDGEGGEGGREGGRGTPNHGCTI